MGTPQTPDSMKKSQQEKAPPPKREDTEPGKLSNPEARDKAEKRVGKVKPAAKPVVKSDKKEKRPQ